MKMKVHQIRVVQDYQINYFKTPDSPISPGDDLSHCLRHMFRFGKLFGVFPFGGIFQGDKEKARLSFSWKSFSTAWTLLATIMVSISLFIGLLGVFKVRGQNAAEWAWASDSMMFYLIGFLVYKHFLLKGQELLNILGKWSNLDLNYPKTDYKLQRDINLTGILLTSGILENTVWTFNGFSKYDGDNDGSSALRNFFENSRTQWLQLVPYHPIIPMFIFFSNKMTMWSWNLADIFVISVSRGIYGKFRNLNKVATEALSQSPDPHVFKQLIKDHETLRDLLNDIANFLSPLIFSLYTANLFFICLQIHLGVTGKEHKGFFESLYAIWAFLHLVAKIYIMSHTAAKVHQNVHQFGDILYKCPEQSQSYGVQMTRQYLGSTKIGLDGLGCFVITKPFILSILNFVFTFEIVLLQSPYGESGVSPSPTQSPNSTR